MPVSFYSEGKKNFVFTSGKNGSLVQINPEKPEFKLKMPPNPPQAKVIGGSPFLNADAGQASSYLQNLKKKRAKSIVSTELGEK